MADDYKVKSRSNADIHRLAKKAREAFGVATHRRIDILACLTRSSIPTVNGIKRLTVLIRPDSEMGDDDGRTSHNRDTVTIELKRSVRNLANVGDGRARNTIAHELGHAVLHDGAAMPRRAAGNITPKWLQPYESAEHQVKVFAPALLINDKIARTLRSSDEVSIEFGVSRESAKIYFDELIDYNVRQENAEKIRRIAEQFRVDTNPGMPGPNFLNEFCTSCGNRTLFPVGSKFMCHTCDGVFDRFQDGDPTDPGTTT